MPSREKGSLAERQVAEMLKKWWAPVEPEAIFKRTPGSGAWGHGSTARAAFRTAGDIVTDSKTWPFAIEVKRRESFSWKPFLAGKPSPVWGWWRQAQGQGEEMKLVPMLWFRRNREPWWVLLPKTAVSPSRIAIAHDWKASILNVNYGYDAAVLIKSEDFLSSDPEVVRTYMADSKYVRGAA